MTADPTVWYLVKCIDCGKTLKVLGEPPDKPICLHCDIIMAAPEADRETIRRTLLWTGEDDPVDEQHVRWQWVIRSEAWLYAKAQAVSARLKGRHHDKRPAD